MVDLGNDGDGDVQIYNQNAAAGSTGWHTILTDAVTFGQTTAFSLTFNGFGAGFDYDVTVGSKSTNGLSYYQGEVLNDYNEIDFVNEFDNTGFEIDNVSVIPEPAALGLLCGMGGAILFIRRRFMI